MIPFRRIFGFVLLANLLSGCLVTFTNPLPKSQPTGQDERLFGTWDVQDQEGNHVLVRFERGSNRETKVTFTGGSGFRDFDFRMVTAKIEGRHYMVLTLAGSSNDKEHIIAKYVVKDGEMALCILDVQKTRAAIARGTLKGENGESLQSGTTITASPKDVLAFLRSPGSNDLYACQELKKLSAK